MALHVYTGSSGAGKSFALYHEIIEQSIRNPNDRFFVIVPEQFSNETQKELVRLHPRHGLLNIDVLSFNRLAHRVFDEVGVKRAELLEEIGKSFVLMKIALDNVESMSLLGSSLTKPGNIAEMKSIISELMLYGIEPDDIVGAAGIPRTKTATATAGDSEVSVAGIPRTQAAPENVKAITGDSAAGNPRTKSASETTKSTAGVGESGAAGKPRTKAAPETAKAIAGDSAAGAAAIPSDKDERGEPSPGAESGTPAQMHMYPTRLGMKLHDIGLVYRKFKDYMHEHACMTSEEMPDVLSRVAERSELLRNSIIVLDGFTGFTPVQLVLVEKLMKLSREMYVAVTLDSRYDPHGPFRKTDLFAMSYEMLGQLWGIAKKIGVKTAPPYVVGASADNSCGRFALSPGLAHLEAELFRRHHSAYAENPEEIRLLAAPNPLGEIREAAKRIARLVREEGCRYRDFAVITGDLGTYSNYVRQIFGETGIPYFIDEKSLLLHNPFVEYVRAAVEVCTDNYSYDSMFRMLRSGLSGLTQREIDLLENHVLALGIRGKKKWREKWVLHSKNEDPGMLPVVNEIRERVLRLMDPFAEAMSRRGGTVEDKTAALYEFCAASGCEAYLAREAEHHSECGRQDLARQYAQVFPRVMGFLDKLVLVLGGEKISMRDYRAIFEAGFAEEKIGIIPPGTDQVLVGDMERSRLSGVKVLFFVGLNEGLVPKPDSGGGMLTESDREILRGSGIRLKPTPRENIAIGRFYMYLALTKPSLRLMLSYSISDSAGEVLRPSYLVSTIKNLFPRLAEEYVSEDIRDNIERPANGMSLLTEGFSRLSERDPSPAFMELFKWYRGRPEYRARTDALLDAACAHRPKDQIGRAVATALYGKELYNSASRLESFAACRFAHFAKYGLAVREREEHEFRAPDYGTIMHSALELFGKKMAEMERSGEMSAPWTGISDDERDRLVEQCIDEAAATYGAMILHDNARGKYQILRMKQTLKTAVWAIQQQLRCGDFQPTLYEYRFNGSENLGAMTAQLPGGIRLVLTGSIDRVDTCRDGDMTYLKIVDYKTGRKDFDINRIYFGLDLQLIIYLNAVSEIMRRNGENTTPAAVFYYRLANPVVDYVAGDTEETVSDRILKEMKVSGIIADDKNVLHHLDRGLGPGNDSMTVPLKLNKDGSISRFSKVLSPDHFAVVSSYVNRKIGEIAAAIVDGAAEMNPYKFAGDSRTPCDYCEYRTMCGFDEKISGCRVRRLEKKDAEDVLLMMMEETKPV